MEKLMNNEHVIIKTQYDVITLTNLRLRYMENQYEKAKIVSILLEKISSIEVHYKSKITFLFVAVLIVIAGLGAGIGEEFELLLAGLVIGAILLILYFISRRHFITISSEGGANIHFHTKGMKREKVIEFIDELENAIRNRREELK
jgi:SNF family Na+-dependent transporter